MNDQEFEKYFDMLRRKEPSADQLNQWKFAVRKELQLEKKKSIFYWSQLAAALFAGFILGGLVFSQMGRLKEPKLLSQNESENATIEYVFTNTR